MIFILFIFATIGLANIMVHGKIMDVIGLRPWLQKHLPPDWFQLFECYECSGVWAGFFCGTLLYLSGQIDTSNGFKFSPLFVILMCGFAGSVFAQTYTDIMYYIRSKIEFTVKDDE